MSFIALNCQICLGNLTSPPDEMEAELQPVSVFDSGKVRISSAKCGHLYHDCCIRQYLKIQREKGQQKRCPTCREKIGQVKKLYPTFCEARIPPEFQNISVPIPTNSTITSPCLVSLPTTREKSVFYTLFGSASSSPSPGPAMDRSVRIRDNCIPERSFASPNPNFSANFNTPCSFLSLDNSKDYVGQTKPIRKTPSRIRNHLYLSTVIVCYIVAFALSSCWIKPQIDGKVHNNELACVVTNSTSQASVISDYYKLNEPFALSIGRDLKHFLLNESSLVCLNEPIPFFSTKYQW